VRGDDSAQGVNRSTEPQLIALLEHYAAATLAGDRPALDALLDPDYRFVSAQAKTFGRERRLAALAASPDLLASLVFSDPEVRPIGEDAAIVRADFTARFHPSAGRPGPERGVSTLVFVRRGERWLLRHQHNSHLA
jgi:hypothetical protein